MDTKNIFQLVQHLTSQNNIPDLVNALAELFMANFPGAKVTVYEVMTLRTQDENQSRLIGIDCLGISPDVYFDQQADLTAAYENQNIHSIKTNGSGYLSAWPIVLYDKTVSHVIRIEHPFDSENALHALEGLIHIFRDVFRILHEKGYDPLTRLLNRQAFDQVCINLAYGTASTSGYTYIARNFNAIAILDIDNFKQINDNYGHAIGDEILVLFARWVRTCLRQYDLFFRYGGEEFVILLKDVDPDTAFSILDRARSLIESKRFPQVGKVTVSVGHTRLETFNHPHEHLSMADKALYYAKENGRNQVRSYEQLVTEGKLDAVCPAEGSADFWI